MPPVGLKAGTGKREGVLQYTGALGNKAGEGLCAHTGLRNTQTHSDMCTYMARSVYIHTEAQMATQIPTCAYTSTGKYACTHRKGHSVFY